MEQILRIGKRLNDAQQDVARCFVDREDEALMTALALASGEHGVFLGEPGTAKSSVVDQIILRLEGAEYYWVQLFGEVTPTDIFGQISISALENEDRHRRNTQGHLPNADVAFLDEVFQARSSVLVGCHSIMQERKYLNGGEKVDCPLVSLFGASNFFPEDPELQALWDRFIFRREVKPLTSGDSIRKMLSQPEPPKTAQKFVRVDELRELAQNLDNVLVPNDVLDEFLGLIFRLASNDDHPIRVSDRRKKKAIKALRAAALLAGRDQCQVEDLGVLRFVLWMKPEDIAVVEAAVADYHAVTADDLIAIGSAALQLVEELEQAASRVATTKEAVAAPPSFIVQEGVRAREKLADAKKELARYKSRAKQGEIKVAYKTAAKAVVDAEKRVAAVITPDMGDVSDLLSELTDDE